MKSRWLIIAQFCCAGFYGLTLTRIFECYRRAIRIEDLNAEIATAKTDSELIQSIDLINSYATERSLYSLGAFVALLAANAFALLLFFYLGSKQYERALLNRIEQGSAGQPEKRRVSIDSSD